MRQLDSRQIAERSIVTKFRKTIWNKFIAAVRDYKLIEDNDRIAVCMSGGKDSMLLALLLRQLQKYSEQPFELEYIVMDPGYSEANLQKLKDNCALMRIEPRIFKSDIFASVEHVEKSPCYLCARMRRGYLYKFAKECGCNKIALGHHNSDVVETVLMGLIYGGQYQTMMPKLHSANYPGMQLIRPMYCINEQSVIAWRNYNKLDFLQCACRFTEKNANPDEPGASKRLEIKRLIADIKKTYPQIEANIFKSTHNVNLNTVIGYSKAGEYHSFLDGYDDIKDDEE